MPSSAMEPVSFLADFAAIVTAVVAVWVWGRFVLQAKRRQWRLEEYLEEQRLNGGDQGMRTALHLMSNLAMTEEQIYTAAFNSKKITGVPMPDERGFAKDILFLYQVPKPGRYSPR